MVGSNLPPGVSIGDKEAPWNQRAEEPLCPDCGNLVAFDEDTDKRWYCPRCEKPVGEEEADTRYV